MKKIIVTTIIFLLAGAVVNVAVAWVITASSTYPGWSRTATVLNNVEWPHSVPSHWPERATTIQPEAFGWRLDRYQAGTSEERDGEIWATEQFCLDIVRVGWPCYALQTENWIDFVVPQQPGDVGHHRFDGQPRRTWWLCGIWLTPNMKSLPLRPIWLGFTVNTIFYAAVLWLLIPGPFVLRRVIRVKRGLCPKCAYPTGESDVCSECGKALPGRTEAMT